MNLHLDANAVLRFLLNDVEDQARQTKSVIETDEACLSNEVLAEVVYVLTKVYELQRATIVDALEGLLPSVICEDPELLRMALEIYRDNRKLDIVDAILAARHRCNGDEILTFDKDLLKYLAAK